MSSSVKDRKKHLKSKSVLLGISGGIAAYKSVELVRRLKDEEATVSVVMTAASQNFVTPLSLEVASQSRVYTSLYDDPMAHIKLTASADIMVIAPATANIISKFAHGIADDLLSTCLLSCSSKIIVAPSMNWRMYENQIFQQNLRKITAMGALQVGPETGILACGEEGRGRMSEVPDIIDAIKAVLSEKNLAGQKIVVTAGPTREYIDPVRFISNRSSGKMGYALARAAHYRGAEVTLISGPVALRPPNGVNFVQAETAVQMLDAVKDHVINATVLIMTAAVADFTPENRAGTKIEKEGNLTLQLRQTRDILSEISRSKKKPFVVGFSAETGRNIRRASEKMKKKNMDMIVYNDVTEPGSGFDVDTNSVIMIDKKGEKSTGLMHKDSVADAILDRLLEIKA